MAQSLGEIERVASGRSIWIDMEGKLRVQSEGTDTFCLDRCEAVLQEVDQWMKDQTLRKHSEAKLNFAKEVLACFDAAYTEGLAQVLAETSDLKLKDLVERRILHAMYAAQSHLDAEI